MTDTPTATPSGTMVATTNPDLDGFYPVYTLPSGSGMTAAYGVFMAMVISILLIQLVKWAKRIFI